jgi:hypothetical protein
MENDLDTIHKFLLVVENRLDCLIDYGYVEECDALEILKDNLQAALKLSGKSNENLRPLQNA